MVRLLKAWSDAMGRFARARYIVPSLVFVVLLVTAMEISPIGTQNLRRLSGGTGMLDMQFGYSPEQVEAMFTTIGDQGRLLYTRLLGLDYVFAVGYTILQSLLISALVRKAGLGGHWARLNLIPLARTVLDLVENGLLLFLLAGFPQTFPAVVILASGVTFVKLVLNYGYIALVFGLGAKTTIRPALSEVKP